jgi:hypothetical protein
MRKYILSSLLFLFTFFSFANDNKPEINIVVKPNNEKIMVEIIKNKKVIYRDRTSEEKRYYFVNLQQGNYIVRLKNQNDIIIETKKFNIK